MKISQKYSHLNGEEYLLVHHKNEYKEIIDVIRHINAKRHRTKVSEEKTMMGKLLYSPTSLNQSFKKEFEKRGWKSKRIDFYVSTNLEMVRQLEPLDFKAQKKLLQSLEHPLMDSYNQTDVVKNEIAVEIQFGKYFAVTYDLFVKHLAFYSARYINIGVEIVPTKAMTREMSTGVPWFEKEIHNVLRHGRTNPPVPLLIIGVEP